MTHVFLFRLNLHACPKACFRWLFRLDDSTRPPITSSGLSYGTQPTGSQSAGFQSHVVNPEPVENREEVAHVHV
ncbi:hypothetical protein Bca4012_052883 [Brassica carinata]